jgi:anthranilate synthase
MVSFNGDMNTGLTLRTIRIKDGIAEVRAGATLLFDSNPEDEEAETELKASAMLSAIRDARLGNAGSTRNARPRRWARARSCWSITRTPSCTRWQTISARPGPR